MDAFLGERCDRLVTDAAGHDVLAQVAHVGVHVERKTVHGATMGQPHADGADLARVGVTDAHPHPGVLAEATDIGETELVQRCDHQSLQRAHVVAGTQRVGHVDDRVADELARPVIRDIATALHRHELGADRSGIDLHIRVQMGARAVREHVRVLEQQQMIVRPVREHRMLQRQRLAIRHSPQPSDVHGTVVRHVGFRAPVPSRGARAVASPSPGSRRHTRRRTHGDPSSSRGCQPGG